MKKRVLALALALVMAVGALPTGAWAADTGDTLVVSDSEAKAVTDQQKEQASTKVATATKNTGGKPTQTQSQTVGESGDGPSTFATNTFYWNISKGTYGDDSGVPKPATLYTSKQEYYFNIWWTGDLEIDNIETFVKWPSDNKYHAYNGAVGFNKKSFWNNVSFFKAGAFSYYWEITYENGNVQKLNVTKGVVNKGDNYIYNVDKSHDGTISDSDSNEEYFLWEEKYSDKVRRFNLNVTAAEGKIIKYKSSNKKVKVDSKGKVTIPKKFVGAVIISVYLSETKNFYASVDKVYVEAMLKTPVIKVSSPKKGQLKVSWKKDINCDGYEILWSTDKKFSKSKHAEIKKKSATSLVIKGLKSKKKYYVYMVSYFFDDEEYAHASNNSKTKSIKIK